MEPMYEDITDKKTLRKAKLILLATLLTAVMIAAGVAYAITALSGTSTATATNQAWAASFTSVTITIPTTTGDTAGSCLGPFPGIAFSCTGTSIISSEHYTLTASATNPNINPETTTLTYSDTGSGWSSSCSVNGGSAVASGGTTVLAVGSNSIVCIVTASSTTADTFSIGMS